MSGMEVKINSNGLSRRENHVLKVFEMLDPKSVSTETLRKLTGYNQKVVHKTIGKLVGNRYLKKTAACEVQFHKSDRGELKKAPNSMREENMIAVLLKRFNGLCRYFTFLRLDRLDPDILVAQDRHLSVTFLLKVDHSFLEEEFQIVVDDVFFSAELSGKVPD